MAWMRDRIAPIASVFAASDVAKIRVAPGGVEPPPADSKSAALSTELRGRADRYADQPIGQVCPCAATRLARLRARLGRAPRGRARLSGRSRCPRSASAR